MALILVIDDDFATQVLLKRSLEKQGYEIIVANNGKEGIAKALETNPALIICDWIMPYLSGLEVCRQLKAMSQLSTTFFILLTSLDSVEARIEGLDAGSDDFLCKPIQMSELEARVRSGLRLHQLSRDLQQQKQLLEAELSEAADYVTSILPEPMQHSALSIDTRFIPSRKLGGDSYDYFWLDEKHLVFYLLDVAGHGLRASLPSLSVINLLRSRNLKDADYYQPSSVISSLNQAFQIDDRNDKYFTMWYGVYNRQNRQLVYSSAGHPPGILLGNPRKKPISDQRLKTVGVPVGMFPNAEYIDSALTVEKGSSLYVFSDGIYEIEQENGSFWGLEKFVTVLQKYQQTSERDLDRLLQFVRNWHPRFQFEDDLSILQIDFH